MSAPVAGLSFLERTDSGLFVWIYHHTVGFICHRNRCSETRIVPNLLTKCMVIWGKLCLPYRLHGWIVSSAIAQGSCILSSVNRYSLGSRREAFLSQNISTCMCSFTFNPAFHQNSKVFSYNLALPLIYWSSLWFTVGQHALASC